MRQRGRWTERERERDKCTHREDREKDRKKGRREQGKRLTTYSVSSTTIPCSQVFVDVSILSSGNY